MLTVDLNTRDFQTCFISSGVTEHSANPLPLLQGLWFQISKIVQKWGWFLQEVHSSIKNGVLFVLTCSEWK